MTPAYSRSRKLFDAVLLVGLSLGALYYGARVTLTPRDATQGAAVIFAPWTTADRALERAVDAGARFVRFGGFSFIVVTVADNADYPARMLAAGAWLVVDPQTLAACSAVLAGVSGS